ncbi:hypothetical protein DVH24_000188 [Malus domestica]|uniref:Uncharacterized protein n=1 Tax=Malus domestica TaxID=3750 RepID=A0A498IYW5_MALDO|nr:hypothetical protein DVH24_000188 [Malus domestica]
MSSKQGGKAKPLKAPKADKKEYDEGDVTQYFSVKFCPWWFVTYHRTLKLMALKELRAKAQQKGSFGGAGLKKSGKK